MQLRCRAVLPRPPRELWAWLTEAPRLERWLAESAEVTPGADGGFSLGGVDEAGEALREEGRTVEVAPPRRWVLAFRRLDAGWAAPTRLELEITPHPEGCELSVLQSDFQRLSLSECLTVWEAYRRRWRRALERLQEAVAGPPLAEPPA